MTVSVIIPTYYRNDVLVERALASVLRQTDRDIEVLIVADGMAHQDAAELGYIIYRQQEHTDIPLRFWNIRRPTYPEDPGQVWCVQGTDARNFGLDHAQGEWVAPLDDDDEWTDDHIEVLLDAVTARGVDFAYGKSVTPWGQWYGHWPPSGMNFTDGSQLYRHDMGYRYDWGCLDRGLPSDADLWERMITGGVTFTFIDRLVHRYFPAER